MALLAISQKKGKSPVKNRKTLKQESPVKNRKTLKQVSMSLPLNLNAPTLSKKN